MKKYTVCTDAPSRLDAFLSASADELRVLFLIKDEGEIEAKEIEKRLSLPESDVRDALAFWRGAGAVSLVERQEKEKKKPLLSADALSPYSPAEAARLMEKENLASFVEACQATYGKVLAPTDIDVILGLHDQLGLSCEYICLLIAFLNRYERKPMRYVEKVAFSLYDRGVLSIAELEEYIERKTRSELREGALRKLFGIGTRALSKKEDECFLRWTEEYGYDDSVIGLAYDITVGATNRAYVAYADKILRRWYEAGCRSLPSVEAFIEREKGERAAAVSASADKKKKPSEREKDQMRSFDVDDMFAHALARSYGEDKSKK